MLNQHFSPEAVGTSTGRLGNNVMTSWPTLLNCV